MHKHCKPPLSRSLIGLMAFGWSAWVVAANTISGANISGVWNHYPPDPPDLPEDPPPPGGEPALKEPYAAQYKQLRQRQKEANDQGRPLVSAAAQCLPEGMPTMMAPHYALDILQTPGRVTIIAEFMSEVRRIYLNASMPPVEDIEPTYAGYSVGKWHGKTFVVETRGIHPDVQYLDFPHTDKMKIIEKFRLVGPDLMEDEITITDPDVLAKPYVVTYQYKREDPSYRVMEYVCDHNRVSVNQDGSFGITVDSQESAKPTK